MPILNNIPRKNRIVPTGGDNTFDLSRVQHVPIGIDGLSYNSPFTPDAMTNATHHNNATVAQVGPMQVEQPGIVVPAATFIRVHPQNKTVLNSAGKVIPSVKRVMGPAPTSNTPFHPKRKPLQPRKSRFNSLTTETSHRETAVATSKDLRGPVAQPIHGQPLHPVGSFIRHSNQTLGTHQRSDLDHSRWDTIKRGAAG